MLSKVLCFLVTIPDIMRSHRKEPARISLYSLCPSPEALPVADVTFNMLFF